jgi:hypothetical protein
MPYLSKWGGTFGYPPLATGRVFFVAPAATYNIDGQAYTASDSNDGQSPQRAFLTAVYAATQMLADDHCILLAGTHTLTAPIVVSVNRLTFSGVPGGGHRRSDGLGVALKPRTIITQSTAATNLFTVTGTNFEVCDVSLLPITAGTAINLSAAATNAYIHHCKIDMSTQAASTSTIGVKVVGANSGLLFENNYAQVTAAQGEVVQLTSATDAVIQNNVVTFSNGTWVQAMTSGTLSANILYQKNTFAVSMSTGSTASVVTAFIDGTNTNILWGASAVLNMFTGTTITKPIDGFGASTCALIENYVSQTGAASGGVLVAAIT